MDQSEHGDVQGPLPYDVRFDGPLYPKLCYCFGSTKSTDYRSSVTVDESENNFVTGQANIAAEEEQPETDIEDTTETGDHELIQELNILTHDQPFIKSGPIKLKSPNYLFKKWRNGFLQLEINELKIFKNERKEKLLVCINVADIEKVVSCDSKSKKQRFCLEVHLQDKVYDLSTENSDVRDSWLEALNAVMNK